MLGSRKPTPSPTPTAQQAKSAPAAPAASSADPLWDHNARTWLIDMAALLLLALGFAASTPARADYALVKFESGYCRIWWDSAGNPFGVAWIKVAVGLPDYEAAVLALNMAVGQGVCR